MPAATREARQGVDGSVGPVPPEPTTPMSVQAAIAEVMRRLPGIGKGNTAPGAMGGFKYRGIEDMTRILQPILADVGLVIVPQAVVSQVKPSPGQKEAWQDVYLHVDWLIVGPDGSQLTASTSGIGRDNTDKGATKAQTQSYKYLLMHLFCVSDAEADADGHDYSNAEREEQAVAEATPQERTWERVLTAVKADPSIGATLKALAEQHGTKLTLRSVTDDEAFHHLIVEALDTLGSVESLGQPALEQGEEK